MKKIIILYLLLFLITIAIANAAEPIAISSKSLTEKVQAGSYAFFTLTITNYQSVDDTFRIEPDHFSVYPFSDIAQSITIEPFQIKIPTGASEKVDVKIKLLDAVKTNRNYDFAIWVKSLTRPDTKVKHTLTAFVISPKDLIKIDLVSPKEIIPGKAVPFSIFFKNTGNIALENVDVYITSEVFGETKTLSFFPYQNLTEDFLFDIDPTTEPGDYTLNIRVYKDQSLKGSYVTQFKILKNPEIKEKTSVDIGFLRLSKKTTIVKTNEGNSAADEKIVLPVSSFAKLFTSTDPAATITEKEGMLYLEWEFSIAPKESYTVKIITDYKPLFIVVLVILLFIFLIFYWLSKGITIKKRVFRIKDEKEGIAELKILLHVKNRENYTVENVKVIDLLPNLIKPTHEFGTLKPDRMQKGLRGLRFIWNLKEIEPGEERIISYKVHSKLHIIGRMTLPAASIQYKNKQGKLVQVRSNRVTLLSKKE